MPTGTEDCFQEGGLRGRDICVPMADSHCCTAEITTACKAIVSQLKINFKKERHHRSKLTDRGKKLYQQNKIKER